MNLTIFLIIVTSIVSYLAFSNREMFDNLKFNAFMVYNRKDYKRLFTHGLLHADWMHLIFNMYVLYAFGDVVEKIMSKEDFFPKTHYLGSFLYVLMYIIALPISSLPSLFKHKENYGYNAVGASGAVSAVVFACIIMYPEMKMGLIFIPLDIPAPIFGLAYLVFSYYMGKRGKGQIAHDAHFAGSIFGLIFPVIINPSILTYFIAYIFLMIS